MIGKMLVPELTTFPDKRSAEMELGAAFIQVGKLELMPQVLRFFTSRYGSNIFNVDFYELNEATFYKGAGGNLVVFSGSEVAEFIRPNFEERKISNA